jgi:hypothetical protein
MPFPWLAAATGVGGLLGYLGQQDTNATNERIANTPQTLANSSQGQGTFAPAPVAEPLYGMLGGIGNQMGQTPTPYFPGQGYVGPSAPTMAGVNMGMQALPQYGQAAGAYGDAGWLYGQAGGLGQWANQGFQDVANNAQRVRDRYNNARDLSQWANQGYQDTANRAGGVNDAYGRAAGLGQWANQGFQDTANMANWGNQGFQDVANRAGGLNNAYGQSASAARGAMGNQYGLNKASMGNYNFLSGAANVGQNPYVQGMLRANERSVMDGLVNQAIPQINAGAQAVNQMGGSRQGMLQGQAVGDAAEALSNTNASMLLNSYGQGLGAQQNALGYTGQMLQNQMAPAQAAGYAADQANQGVNALRMGAQDRLSGINALRQGAADRLTGMTAMGASADYANQGVDALRRGAADRAAGMGVLGAGADYANQGMNAMLTGANARVAGMNAMGTGADYRTRAGQAYSAAGDALDTGGAVGQRIGGGVENYRQRALDDAMSRYQYQYGEPWNRAGQIASLLQSFQPLGTTYNNSAGTGSASGPVLPQQSPWLAAGQGAVGLGMLGYDIYRNGQQGNNQSSGWLGQGTPQQQVGRYQTGVMTGSPFFPTGYLQ